MPRLYAVSDIHGYLDEFIVAMQRAFLLDDQFDWTGGDAVLVILGDFIDRGPHSRGVVELIIKLKQQAAEAGGRLVVLLGNHEAMMIQGLRHKPSGDCWVEHGGLECLASYGWDGPTDRYRPQMSFHVLETHKDFFMSLQGHYLHADGTLFVHAGVSPQHKLSDLETSTQHLWIRPGSFVHRNPLFLKQQYDAERVVFGHTPMDGPAQWANGRFLCIDTGSFLPHGSVTVVEILPELGWKVAG